MNLFLISKFLSFTLHFSKFVMLSKGNDPFREEHLAYGTNSNNFNSGSRWTMWPISRRRLYFCKEYFLIYLRLGRPARAMPCGGRCLVVFPCTVHDGDPWLCSPVLYMAGGRSLALFPCTVHGGDPWLCSSVLYMAAILVLFPCSLHGGGWSLAVPLYYIWRRSLALFLFCLTDSPMFL